MQKIRAKKPPRAMRATPEALRAWLASPAGATWMEQAARDAATVRAELEQKLRVPTEAMRARVTI